MTNLKCAICGKEIEPDGLGGYPLSCLDTECIKRVNVAMEKFASQPATCVSCGEAWEPGHECQA